MPAWAIIVYDQTLKTEMLHSKSNPLRQIREALLIGNTELARKASVSPATIDRIEKGFRCRLDTQRRIAQVFGAGFVGYAPSVPSLKAITVPTKAPRCPLPVPKTFTLTSICASQSFEAGQSMPQGKRSLRHALRAPVELFQALQECPQASG